MGACACVGGSQIEQHLTDFVEDLRIRRMTEKALFELVDKYNPSTSSGIREINGYSLAATTLYEEHEKFRQIQNTNPSHFVCTSLLLLSACDNKNMSTSLLILIDRLKNKYFDTNKTRLEDFYKTDYDVLQDITRQYCKFVSYDVAEAYLSIGRSKISPEQATKLKAVYGPAVIDVYVSELLKNSDRNNIDHHEFIKNNKTELQHWVVRERLREIFNSKFAHVFNMQQPKVIQQVQPVQPVHPAQPAQQIVRPAQPAQSIVQPIQPIINPALPPQQKIVSPPQANTSFPPVVNSGYRPNKTIDLVGSSTLPPNAKILDYKPIVSSGSTVSNPQIIDGKPVFNQVNNPAILNYKPIYQPSSTTNTSNFVLDGRPIYQPSSTTNTSNFVLDGRPIYQPSSTTNTSNFVLDGRPVFQPSSTTNTVVLDGRPVFQPSSTTNTSTVLLDAKPVLPTATLENTIVSKVTPTVLTATAITPSPVQLQHFRKDCLTAHNEKRSLHNSNSLEEDSELSDFAQNWANNLAETDNLVHSSGLLKDMQLGENIAKGSAILDNPASLICGKWYEESTNYDFSKPGSQSNTKNFTQMIWKNSKKVGFGLAYSKTGNTYVVVNYFPAGNEAEGFAENVTSKVEKIDDLVAQAITEKFLDNVLGEQKQ